MSNFGCCGGNKKKEKVIVDDKDTINAILATGNVGQRYIYGGFTKTQYGYFGQGDLILGVAKEDIRARPTNFVCPNCYNDFVVTKTDVYCGTCSRVLELTQIEISDLVKSVADSQKPTSPPPPPPQPVSLPSSNLYEIANIDFGRTVNTHHKKILADNKVFSLYDVKKCGFDGLVDITGIGEKVAKALMRAVELEIS